jgi:WD40 repeat protein
LFSSNDLNKLSQILADPNQAAGLSQPQLDAIIQFGAISALESDGSPAASQNLAIAICGQAAPEIRDQAYKALLRLCAAGSPTAADALFWLALEHDHLAAKQHILATNLNPGKRSLQALLHWFSALEDNRTVDLALATQAYFVEASPGLRERVLAAASHTSRFRTWGRMLEALMRGQSDQYETVITLYPSLSETERKICRDFLTQQALEDQEAREALFSLFILYEDTDARDALLAAAYLPSDSSRQALFLFLTNQVASYQDLDFDHNLLVYAYEHASKALRRRILTFSRQTGQIEWLRAISQAADVRYLSDLGDADWEAAINRLFETERYPELWRLTQNAPARWSAVILARLAKNDWKPTSAADKENFTALATLAQECWRKPLDLQPIHTFHAPSDDLTCLALDTRHSLLAGGTTGQHIYLWQIPSGDLNFPSLIGPANITRALAFSPDGEFLATADGDQRIRVFRNGSGQVVKTIEGHRGLVRALAIHPSGRILASAGFDGQIRTWRFPIGSELKRMDSDIRENFCLAILADGETLVSGGVGWNLNVWKISEGTLLRRIPAGSEGIVYLASAHASDLFASAGRDRAISVWNSNSGLLVRRFSLQPSAISGMAFLPDDHMLVTAGGDGALYLWNLSSNEPIARLKSHSNAIVAMTISTDGQTLVSADSSGELKLWNFSALVWTRRSFQPGQPIPLQELQDRLKVPGLPAGEKSWLEFTAALWQWIRRFDIELAEPFTIPLGEFDIEL